MCTSMEKTWGPKHAESQAAISSACQPETQASIDVPTERNALVLSTSTEPTLDFSSIQVNDIPRVIREIDTITWREVMLLDNLYQRFTEGGSSDLSQSILIVHKISWQKEKHSSSVQSIHFWPQYPILSKAFRYAALEFACRNQGIADNREVFEYHGKFLCYTQKALNERSFVEAAIAIYAKVLNESAATEGFAEVMRHFTGLCTVLKQLNPAETSAEECQLLKRVFQGALKVMRVAFWASHDPEDRLSDKQLNELISLCRTLQLTPLSLLGFPNYGPAPIVNNERTELTNGLECQLFFYLDTYLGLLTRHSGGIEASSTSNIDSLELALLNTIEILALLIPQNPVVARILGWANSNPQERNEDVMQLIRTAHLDDIKAVFLFAWIKLLRSLIYRSTSATGAAMATSAAMALYGLNVAITDQEPKNTSALPCPWFPISRSLFWSGVVVTREVDPAGIDLCLQRNLLIM